MINAQNKNFKIGEMVYVVDNSYSVDLATGEPPVPSLAGSNSPFIPNIPVFVASEPYKTMIKNINGELKEMDVIQVSLFGHHFRVLNYLSECPRSVEDWKDEIYTAEI